MQMWAEAGEFGKGMVPEQLQTGHRFRFEIPKFHALTIKLNYCPNLLIAQLNTSKNFSRASPFSVDNGIDGPLSMASIERLIPGISFNLLSNSLRKSSLSNGGLVLR